MNTDLFCCLKGDASLEDAGDVAGVERFRHVRAVGIYGGQQRRALAGAQLERAALIEAARRLKGALDPEAPFGGLARALRFNLTLWTVLEADLGGGGHSLPQDVRADLIALARFVRCETVAVLQAAGWRQRRGLEALIDVNRELCRAEPAV